MTNRELEAWIAEHVMGWKRSSTCCGRGDFFVHETGATIITTLDGLKAFSPTTNKSDALTVLETCAEKTELRIVRHKNSWGIIAACDVTAPTLAEAICKFAYRLFGGKEAL